MRRHTGCRWHLPLLGTLLLVGAAGASPPEPAPSPTAVALAELAWMAGDWRGVTAAGEVSQEVWAAPAGDCMMGMWRWVVAGRVKLFELLTITREDTGPVMRLRHFDRAGVGREEKDAPVTLRLVGGAGREAVFAGPGEEATVRLTYRLSGPDELTALLEKPGAREEYRFRRAAAALR